MKSKIKNHPAKPKYPQKRKTGRKETIFCLRRDFCPRQFFLRQKIPKTKNPKMENLPRTKKSRLVADFTLDHTGGWGGVSSRMVIGNLMVIKGLT